MSDDEVVELQITPKGFQTVVAMVLAGEEFAAHHDDSDRPHRSLLDLAREVAARMIELDEAAPGDPEACYQQAVRELAPHFAQQSPAAARVIPLARRRAGQRRRRRRR